jgi:hypothetical protein
MTATLYRPGYNPINVSVEGLYSIDQQRGLVPQPANAAFLLECVPQLVDILACDSHYIAYSIFDSEQSVNCEAMDAISKLSGFDMAKLDATLRGNVLIIVESINTHFDKASA